MSYRNSVRLVDSYLEYLFIPRTIELESDNVWEYTITQKMADQGGLTLM